MPIESETNELTLTAPPSIRPPTRQEDITNPRPPSATAGAVAASTSTEDNVEEVETAIEHTPTRARRLRSELDTRITFVEYMSCTPEGISNFERKFNLKYQSTFDRCCGNRRGTPAEVCMLFEIMGSFVFWILVMWLILDGVAEANYTSRLRNSSKQIYNILNTEFIQLKLGDGTYSYRINFDFEFTNQYFTNTRCNNINYMRSFNGIETLNVYNKYKNASRIEAYFDYTTTRPPTENPCNLIWFNPADELSKYYQIVPFCIPIGTGIAVVAIFLPLIVVRICRWFNSKPIHIETEGVGERSGGEVKDERERGEKKEERDTKDLEEKQVESNIQLYGISPNTQGIVQTPNESRHSIVSRGKEAGEEV